MKFKLDENLGELGAEVLRLAGFEVATVTEEGMCSSEDPDLIAVCRREGRCLVTMDKHFSNPFVYPPGKFAGIVVLRVGSPTAPDDVRTAMETLVEGLKTASVRGRLWIIRQGRIREYNPFH